MCGCWNDCCGEILQLTHKRYSSSIENNQITEPSLDVAVLKWFQLVTTDVEKSSIDQKFLYQLTKHHDIFFFYNEIEI